MLKNIFILSYFTTKTELVFNFDKQQSEFRRAISKLTALYLFSF